MDPDRGSSVTLEFQPFDTDGIITAWGFACFDFADGGTYREMWQLVIGNVAVSLRVNHANVLGYHGIDFPICTDFEITSSVNPPVSLLYPFSIGNPRKLVPLSYPVKSKEHIEVLFQNTNLTITQGSKIGARVMGIYPHI